MVCTSFVEKNKEYSFPFWRVYIFDTSGAKQCQKIFKKIKLIPEKRKTLNRALTKLSNGAEKTQQKLNQKRNKTKKLSYKENQKNNINKMMKVN